MRIESSTLDCGMKVISERISSMETVSLGIWLDLGSRDESPRENGMFHFIEHTLFKGTPSRDARAIAESVDGVGGSLDAYTGKEETCYSVRVRAKHLDLVLEILADMLLRPLFEDEELNRERRVVLEEMKMEEDNPEDVAFEKSLQHFWEGHALGRPILGSPENVMRFDHQEVAGFHGDVYQRDRLVVAAVGRVDHSKLVRRLHALFPGVAAKGASSRRFARSTPRPSAFQKYEHRPHLEQVNFCLSFPGLALNDDRRYVLYLLNTLLGGGMSSRLFQAVREERGLAYTIGSFSQLFSDCGQWLVYGGCGPESFQEVMRVTHDEIRRLREDNLAEPELRRAKEQFIGNYSLSLESTVARASALARQWIFLNQHFDMAELIERVEAVTLEEIADLSQQLLRDECLGVYAVGPFDQSVPQPTWSVA